MNIPAFFKNKDKDLCHVAHSGNLEPLRTLGTFERSYKPFGPHFTLILKTFETI